MHHGQRHPAAQGGWWRRTALQALVAAVASLACLGSSAAAYPDKPVRIVLGFAPGGATDVLARLVAQKLGDRMGQQFIVDNKPGAATRIGMEAVQKSAPDGYVLGLATAVTTTFPLMFDGVTFAPGKDFVPVTMLGRAPSFLVVRNELPAKTYQEFVAYGKSSGKLTLGHAGQGSNPHIAGMALARSSGMSVTPVPYKGQQPVAVAVGSGEVDFAMLEYNVARPMLERGAVRLLAVTEPKRSSLRPEVPTGRELGMPDQVEGLSPWFMLIAPPGTPAPIVASLNQHLREVMMQPDVRAALATSGLEPETASPEDTAAYFESQRARIRRLVGDLGLSLKN